MTAAPAGFGNLQSPFPGLRAFDADEALLFYGRERQVADLLDRLSETRFVAVTGSSGSGKSSLVRAGLRPALQRGYLIDASSRWRFAVMRPGGAPLEALASALAGALESEPAETLLRTLEGTSDGLVEATRRANLPAGESLLVIADQFEELFRFDISRNQQADASLFVSQLLAATEQRQVPIYVVMTMRSEFLGRCSEFSGLVEACNRSQYLVPRLTRDERQEAIERPLRLFGASATPALVQQVLNEAGDDPDMLPVLQHVMLRTWHAWTLNENRGRLDQQEYASVGGSERALDVHGDEILRQFSTEASALAERLFRSLTVVQNGVVLRRPRRLQELYGVVGAIDEAGRAAVDAVIKTFANRENSFLSLTSSAFSPGVVVDITHESLIRKWRQLDSWVREEARSAEWLADLLRDVARHKSGEAGLWEDPELSTVQRRRRLEGWTEAWANQYRRPDDPSFEAVTTFLDASEQAQAEALRKADARREHELAQALALAAAKRRQTVILGLLLVGVVVIAAVLWGYVRKDSELAETTARYQKVTQDAAKAADNLARLEKEQAALRASASTGTAATPAEQARLQELTQQIQSVKAQASASETELARLRKDQELSSSDRGVLLKQVDTLRQQLTQVSAERDKLQYAQKAGPSPVQQTSPPDDRVATLTKQLEQERTKSNDAAAEIARLRGELAARSTDAPQSNASVQDVTKAYTDGVRAYDLRNWSAAAAAMQNVVKMQAGVSQRPKEVRMSGTRFVPWAPYSYLAAALGQLKTDCSQISPALSQAAGESAPTELRGGLQTARTQCP